MINPPMQRIRSWTPWALLAVLGVLYLVELFGEFRRDLMTIGGMLAHAVASLLIFLPAVLALEVVIEHQRSGTLKPWVRNTLFWTPRVLMIVFSLFLSLFALDVFGEGYAFWETVLALLIHLIPVYVMLGIVAVAWRWEWVGTVLLIGWAVWYTLTARGFPLSVYVELAGLPLVLAVLFWLNWQYRDEIRRGRLAA